jgi:AcrR family transcriptional regulator
MTAGKHQHLEQCEVEDGKGTEQRIIDAAVEVLNNDGERAIRVQDIAVAAGVTKPSIYHFFGSREGLIESAQAERYRRDVFIRTVEIGDEVRKCNSRDEFYELTRRLLIAASDPQRDVFIQRRVEILGSAMSRPSLEKKLMVAQREIDQVLASALSVAQTKDWIPRDLDLQTVSTWINGQLNGRVFLTLKPGRIDRSDWVNLFIDGVLAVFGASVEEMHGNHQPNKGGANVS